MRDIVFLQDLSISFDDDLPVLQSLIEPLLDTLTEQEADTSFGITSFVDKPVGSFGGGDDYVYELNVPLTEDRESIVSTVNEFLTLSGGDFLEAQLEGLLQATIDSDLGYRDEAERFIILATDAGFHVAPDGIDGSPDITRPNNVDDVVDADEDYPSIEQIETVLEDNDVTPIFLVTSAVQGEYESLVEELGTGQVVVLTSNSSNVVDAVRLAFAEESGDITEGGTIEPDDIVGTDGNDGLFGAIGNDTIFGGLGADLIDGGSDDDLLDGGEGADSLEGGTGLDTLDGGEGPDLIEGGLDADVLSGSEAADVFAGTTAELDGDTILDFAEEDDILFRGVDFATESLTVTNGESTILDVDVDLDELVDSSLTLEGDYSDETFFVSSESAEDGTLSTFISLREPEIEPDSDSTIYRFFNSETGVHLYATFDTERDELQEDSPDLVFEGASFQAAESDSLTGAVLVYSLLNTDTGASIYTIFEEERDFILENLSNYASEEVAYFAYETEQEGTIPLYRFYNSITDTHFFTASLSERNSILENSPEFQAEGEDGIAFYVEPVDI